MPQAIAGPLIKGAVSFGASKLFGGKSKSSGGAAAVARNPVGFRSEGLDVSFSGDNFDLRRGSGVDDALNAGLDIGIQTTDELEGLKQSVRPGFSMLRKARLGALGENRKVAFGGLREELRRRRVAGSTFANEEERKLSGEFSRLQDQIEAESFLQSMEATSQLIGKQFEVAMSSVNQVLEQFNFESSVAANLSQSANALAGDVAAAQSSLATTTANIDAENAAGLGSIIAPAIDALTEKIIGPVQTKPSNPGHERVT